MQLGVLIKKVTIGLALAGASLGMYGVAHADAIVNTDTHTTVDTSANSQVNIESSHTSTTTVGTSTNNNDKNSDQTSNSASGNSTDGPSKLNLQTSADTAAKSLSSDTTLSGSTGQPDSSSSAANLGGGDHSALQSAASGNVMPPVSPAVSSIIRQAQDRQQANPQPIRPQFGSGKDLAQPVSSDPDSPEPVPAPHSFPVGALQSISGGLAATVVSSGGFGGLGTQPLENSPTAVIKLLLALIIAGAGVLLCRFVDRLRRSGFSHAARSDVASFISSFATPKVSFVWAVSPAQNSLLYFGSEIKILKLTNAI